MPPPTNTMVENNVPFKELTSSWSTCTSFSLTLDALMKIPPKLFTFFFAPCLLPIYSIGMFSMLYSDINHIAIFVILSPFSFQIALL